MPRSNSQCQLDNHLTLHAWLNKCFRYETTRSLLSDVEKVDEGFDPDGHSPVCKFLMYRAELNPKIEEALPIYDANIKRHLAAINNKRTQPIVLRYFQYLALLYTEIFLDWKFNRPEELLRQLNAFVQAHNDAKTSGDTKDTLFTTDDLEKLAFWMATGAGKTLIMHINYHQYLHYCKEALDHIVLITPNEGLSEQHLRELANSDIRCERFNVEGNHLTRIHKAVQIIEITKLVEERTGGGVSVPVEAFEGNNLIFVDEGHKGSGGQAWRDYRAKVAETGFTFEYSATFGQALAAANSANLVEEYGKAIAFDYSYRYFYGDGYGKDFRIINVRHDEETQTETLLLGNLLSFYEQRHYFKQNTEAVHTYALDSPLWAFVGSKVNAVYIENHCARSDILNVLRFLHRFLKNEGDWAIHTIKRILNDNSGLSDENGTDVFYNRLNHLKELYPEEPGDTPAQMYADILNEVFHTETSGALRLCDVRNAQGEIGLKTTNGRNYFGVIYIGDTSAFNKLVKNDDAGIGTESEDVLTESLFNDINSPASPINILIGAKKFIEGWDSWRVTAMGLLNIGKNEGSQIIQLFGRGVRLRGKDMSLKRSAALDGENPRNLSLLETLNIFAVRANFMKDFREYLTREGIPYNGQLELPTILSSESLPDLCLPKAPSYSETTKGQCVLLKADPAGQVTHKMQIADIIQSYRTAGIQEIQAGPDSQHVPIPDKSLKLINWEWIYLQLLEYKQEKGFHNLVIDTDVLKKILDPNEGLYQLSVTEASVVDPQNLVDLERLEVLVLTILRKYITKFYRLVQQQVNTDNMTLDALEEDDPNLSFGKWKISFRTEDAELIQQLREYGEKMKRIAEEGSVYGSFVTPSLAVYIENHLYQPLLAIDTRKDLFQTTPPALVKSEQDFVKDLRSYLEKQCSTSLASKQIFLLRNQSRGKGVGFYQNEGFYPDFILWILDDRKQRIVFIEPHCMVHEAINYYNDKILLHKRLRKFSERQRFQDKSVHMDSYIISTTDLPTLRHKHRDKNIQDFEALHILCRNPSDPTYLSPIFEETPQENE